MTTSAPPIRLGLRENWAQFSLLVLVNAFVGAMVGIERALLPLLAEQEFGLASRSAILSFIAAFGAVKAITNLFAGRLNDRIGRRRVLIIGWLFGLPVPLIIMFAPDWSWVVAANALLGINQGLAWSTTVVMKIDLVGAQRRGLALGLNEAAGYLAVAAASFGAGALAAATALRPQPFLIGLVVAILGLLISIFFVRDTRAHAALERRQQPIGGPPPSFAQVVLLTSWRNRTLFGVSQAGMINNLNDGMVWGLFPLYFAAAGLPAAQISLLAALYPAVWGLSQLATGALSDRIGRKRLIVGGMLIQALGLTVVPLTTDVGWWALGALLLGLGTAMVYPTLLAVIGDVAQADWRASAVGVYRLWRDGGYVVGALLSGVIADLLGMPAAILTVAALTLGSGLLSAAVMQETVRRSG
jgi:MFS family permease